MTLQLIAPPKGTPSLGPLFLGGVRSTWVSTPGMEVYVRKAQRRIRGIEGYARVLDIGNVKVVRKGRGCFTKWLGYAEESARAYGMDAVLVENLLNPRLAGFLQRRGYSEIDHGCGGPKSYYRLLADGRPTVQNG